MIAEYLQSETVADLLCHVLLYLDVLSMIHDLLHFFHERNQPNFTLVVVKFYNGLRNVHYRERFNLVSECVPQLRFLYLCCLLWFDSSILYSVEFTVQCRCLQIPSSCSIQKHQQNFHLETELDAKKLTMYECLRPSFNGLK